MDKLTGVYYSDCYVEAADSHLLIKIKHDYPAENEGKILDKSGNKIEGSFPNTDKIVPSDNVVAQVFAAADMEMYTSAIKKQNREFNAEYARIVIKAGEGYYCYDVEGLNRFARAAQKLGATELCGMF